MLTMTSECQWCDSALLSEQLMCRHQIASKLLVESNFIFNCNHLYVENFKSSSIAVLVARLQFGGNGDSCENVEWLTNWTLHACITVVQHTASEG